MSIISRLTDRIGSRQIRRYAERKLVEQIADRHHPAVMATVREQYPELSADTIPSALVSSIVRCANRRLIEHIL